ncbi:MAG: carbohydrate ABC transporter permease [Firmicutes bacterium]|nr:carbohydrate ABC transporter permease [Bacillota bacterium]
MKTFKRVIIHLVLVAVAIYFLFPLLFMVRTSLVQANEYFSLPPTFDFYLEHFKAVLSNGDFTRYLLNSFLISTITVILVLIIGSMAGYALARYDFKRKDDFLFFALTTRMGPPVAFVLPFYVLMLNLRLIDTYIGLIIVYMLSNLAFGIWMSYSFFQDVPISIEEAAQIDGCSRLRTFWKVTLPLSAPGLLATGIFMFIMTWNEYFYAFILTRYRAKTFPVHIPSFFGAYSIEWGQMFAASVIATLPVLIFGILIRKYLVRGMTFGAMK